MKDKLEIEAEVRSLELVHSVVEDAHYQATTFYVTKALEWVLSDNAENQPAKLLADDYKKRETTTKSPVAKPVEQPANPMSAPTGRIMEIEGERFLIPPFQWRDPGPDEQVTDWLKWFVGALKEYVKEVFGQVKVKDE